MLNQSQFPTESTRVPGLQIRSLTIVSPNSQQAKLLKACLDSAFKIVPVHHEIRSLEEVFADTIDPSGIYLLDSLNMGSNEIEYQLNTGFLTTPNPALMVLYNLDADFHPVLLIKRHKIRGMFSCTDSQTTFIKGMKTILNGGLWLSRKMLADCILTPASTSHRPPSKEVALLSKREIEILRHVASGQSNQQIAEDCELSVYTVKTHLYNTYKKINATNRLQAALWTATFLDQHHDN